MRKKGAKINTPSNHRPSSFHSPQALGCKTIAGRKTPAIFCANLGCQRSINTSGSTVITLVPLNVSNVGLLLGHLAARLVSPEAWNGFSPRRGNVSICCIFFNSGEACLMLVLVVSLLMTWLVFVVVICSLLTQILETCPTLSAVTPGGLSWRSSDSGVAAQNFATDKVESLGWSIFGRMGYLRVVMTDGTEHRLDGFPGELFGVGVGGGVPSQLFACCVAHGPPSLLPSLQPPRTPSPSSRRTSRVPLTRNLGSSSLGE